jgi:pyridoxine kinase
MPDRPPAVLSIQSRVVYGHVGNAAAVLALATLGIDAWPLDTVTLSSHLGYPEARGDRHGPERLAPLLDGLDAIGALAECGAVMSGYIGAAANAAIVVDAVARVKRGNEDAFYVCDPVLGEFDEGLYVDESVARATRKLLLPIADILVPNQFELGWLAGGRVDSVDAALAASRRLVDAATSDGRTLAVVTTGIASSDSTALTSLLVDGDGAWRCEAPRVPLAAHGTGDYFAARLTGRLLRGADRPTALAAAIADTARVVAATGNRRELVLVGEMPALPGTGIDAIRIA